MNNIALSGVALALTMLEDDLNLNIINLMIANNKKLYSIKTNDESIDISLKGGELKNLGNYIEEIFEFIGNKYDIDTTFDRNDDDSFIEVLTNILNQYIYEHNDKILEMYPEDADDLIAHKVEYMDQFSRIINNLRSVSNEYDYEDDVLTFAGDLLILMGYEIRNLKPEEVKSTLELENEILIDNAQERESDSHPFYHWMNNKKQLDSEQLKDLNIDRIKLLVYATIFGEFRTGLTNTVGFDNVLQQYISDGRTMKENLLFHDRKTAPIENEMLKIKMFNAITKGFREDTNEQEKEVIKLFNERIPHYIAEYLNPVRAQSHYNHLKELVMLLASTNIGYERQLLAGYIITILSIIKPQEKPVKNIRDFLSTGKKNQQISIEELEDIIRNNYEVANNPIVIRNAIKSIKNGLNIQKNNKPIMPKSEKDSNLDNLANTINQMLGFLGNLDSIIHLDDSEIDELLIQSEDDIDHTEEDFDYNEEFDENGRLIAYSDDERKVLEEYMPKDFNSQYIDDQDDENTDDPDLFDSMNEDDDLTPDNQ